MLNLYDIFEELLTESLITEDIGIPKRKAKRKPIKSGSTKNILELLKNNIELSITCKIYYSGDNTENKGWRTIEPYAVGIHKKGDNNMVLRARQLTRTKSDTPNGTMKGKGDEKKVDPLTPLPGGWRLFRVDWITDIDTGGKKFRAASRSEFNPHDKDMKNVVANAPNSHSWTKDETVPRDDDYEEGSGRMTSINTFGK